MAKVIEKSAKTVEDALKAALEELGVNENEVNYEVIEEPSNGLFGLIGTKPAKIRVIVKETLRNEDVNEKVQDIAIKENSYESEKEINEIPESTNANDASTNNKIDSAKKFLENVLNKMNLDVEIERDITDNYCTFNLHGENLGILIGKHGQTLDSLQYLVNIVANKEDSQIRIRFIVDVENYRKRRTEILQHLANSLADRAIRMNQDVKLEPMNRHERKVIHSTLQDNNKVFTHSVGEEPHRYVVISPKKYGKTKNNKKFDK